MSAAPVEGYRYVEVTGGVTKVTDDVLRVPEDFIALQLQQLPAETEGGRRRRKVRPVGGRGRSSCGPCVAAVPPSFPSGPQERDAKKKTSGHKG